MSEKGIWLGGLAALAILSFFCIRHHLSDSAEATAVVAAPAAVGSAPAAAVSPALAAPRLSAQFDGKTITLEGIVTDEAMRQAVLDRAVSIHGAGQVVNRLQLGATATPAWASGLASAFPPDLRALMAAGSATVAEGVVVLEGQLRSEPEREQLVAAVVAANPKARVDNRLTVAQAQATAAAVGGELSLRTVEFASDSADLTAPGRATLDAIVPLFQRDTSSRFEIAGHTDSLGDPIANQALGEARARAVRAYLALNGVDATRFTTKGYGATRPAADNRTAEGRQRNRRIEFRPI